MSDWFSYQFQDFVPFTTEIYFRLQERTGEAFWPLHVLTLGLGCLMVFWTLTHKPRMVCLLLAPLWALVGIGYFLYRYTELNWAGLYIGWAFLAQGLLFLLTAISSWSLPQPTQRHPVTTMSGLVIVLFGLLGYPLIAPLLGYPWLQAETFGIHPTPTAITSIGLILLLFQGVGLWLTALLPVLWISWSGLTLMVLNAPWDTAQLSVILLCLIGILSSSLSPRPQKG